MTNESKPPIPSLLNIENPKGYSMTRDQYYALPVSSRAIINAGTHRYRAIVSEGLAYPVFLNDRKADHLAVAERPEDDGEVYEVDDATEGD